MGGARNRLLTVSNRGPVEFQRNAGGEIIAVPGQGGLATALRSAAAIYPTTWLSSPMTDCDREIARNGGGPSEDGFARFVPTDPETYALFYAGFANEALWFLQHSMPWPDEMDDERLEHCWRDGYVEVNRAFAEEIVRELNGASYNAVMFHDYHFYTAPALVKMERPDVFLQQFIHIPWPCPEEWERLGLPILGNILAGLLGNDSLVFQTPESARNFLLTVRETLPGADVDLTGGTARLYEHTTRVWANGISVDPCELESASRSEEYSRHRFLLRSNPGQQTIVRVDRLDPSKNVIRGFEAYRTLLHEHPELHEKVYFLAFFIPSRSDIPYYRKYQQQTYELVEVINREFGNMHWKPIRVLFENNRVQALAAMSLYDVLLVNSLADGMNLVAKEGPMLNLHDGVLVLSERAGAYAELAEGALGIAPDDIDSTAAALYRALTMSAMERRERASRLRRTIRRHDLNAWFGKLLDDIEVNAPLARTPAA